MDRKEEETAVTPVRERKDNHKNSRLWNICSLLFIVLAVAAAGILAVWAIRRHKDALAAEELRNMRQSAEEMPVVELHPATDTFVAPEGAADRAGNDREANEPSGILPEYRELYACNPDMIGWLSIGDTKIDYPVMQTPEDEEHYLHLDFYGEPNDNGCLIMDTDSVVGTGTAVNGYEDGTFPSTNLIIHGHTMRSGEMFGNLQDYEDPQYGKEHAILHFDSLYEKRDYELIAVFFSRVYYADEDVFKYYGFFQADTEEEFNSWYSNICALRLYDTGVEAGFGDEFLTLSCCAYHVENGRFVVVARRIK